MLCARTCHSRHLKFVHSRFMSEYHWKTLHALTGKSTKSCTNFISDEDGNPIVDPETAANTFNNFCTSMHKTLNTANSNSDENADLNNIKKTT